MGRLWFMTPAPAKRNPAPKIVDPVSMDRRSPTFIVHLPKKAALKPPAAI